MFRTEIPCSHIYHITGKFPTPPEINLEISKSSDELELIHEDITANDKVFEISDEDKLRNKLVKVIRRYSGNKNESDIRANVSAMTFNDEFANGMPTICHEVISDAIIKYFSGKNDKVQISTDASSSGVEQKQ